MLGLHPKYRLHFITFLLINVSFSGKNDPNCLQNERVQLKMFSLSYFEYDQVWLNMCMDDGHLSKTEKNKKEEEEEIIVSTPEKNTQNK
jgi:hypothetical protein